MLHCNISHMKPDHPFAKLMAQATSLTRRGSLVEATQAIQRALHLNRHPAPAAPEEPLDSVIVLDGLVREIETPPTTPHPPTPRPGPPRPARFDELPFATAQGLRHFKLFTPAGLPDDQPAPLLVMLHGCKQNPDDFAAGTRMNELAQEQGFRVLYPAQAPRSNAHRCWNWFQPGDQKRGGGEPALLAAITRHVMQSHAVHAERVYVAGLSAGGAMATILANEYPDLFAAVGVHSGLPQGAASDVAGAFNAMKHGPRHALEGAERAAPAADRLPRRPRRHRAPAQQRAAARRRRAGRGGRRRGGGRAQLCAQRLPRRERPRGGRALAGAWLRPRLVGRQRQGQLHRCARARCVARDVALLHASTGSEAEPQFTPPSHPSRTPPAP